MQGNHIHVLKDYIDPANLWNLYQIVQILEKKKVEDKPEWIEWMRTNGNR